MAPGPNGLGAQGDTGFGSARTRLASGTCVFLQRRTKAATRDAHNAARLALSVQLFSGRWFRGSTGYPDSRLGQGHEESEEEKMAKTRSKTKAKKRKWS